MICKFEFDTDSSICPICRSKSFILISKKPACRDCVYHTMLHISNSDYSYCTLLDIHVRPDRMICQKFSRKPINYM
ncbi:MAG: hypothetical protein QXY40_10690 [Candidatus Methanomethylicia archaeon]